MSLRARLLLIALALLAVALLVSETVATGALRTYLTDQADRDLTQASRLMAHRPEPLGELLSQQQTPAPAPTTAPTTTPKAAPTAVPSGGVMSVPRHGIALPSRVLAEYVTLDGRRTMQIRSPGAENEKGPELPLMDAAGVAKHHQRPFETGSIVGNGRWRVLAVPLSNGSGSVVVATSLSDLRSTVDRLREVCLAIGLLCVAVLGIVGWFAIRAGLRPLRRIEETAAAFAGGDLSHRVPVTAPGTEVGRLSSSLNGMLAQIEEAFAARAESETRMRRFIADASHELRTPLSSIRGFAELYRMGALSDPAEVARTMKRIEDEAKRMGGLVEDLLELARLDEQRPLRLTPVDLRILAADAVHDIGMLAPDRAVGLSRPGGGPARPVVVLGDEARLRQVVGNLVSNALKHTPEGTEIGIVVGTVRPVWDPDTVHGLIEVADEGPGMDDENARRVFERFYRVDSSRSRERGGGSGLGLAIVAALVAAHGGRVEVRTELGRGSAFRVLLPLSGASDQPSVPVQPTQRELDKTVITDRKVLPAAKSDEAHSR